jgi:Flp pilus assembly protein TadD
MDQGKYTEAEGFLKRALTICEKALGENDAQVAGTLNALALLYRDQGQYGEAEGLFQRALAIYEKASGKKSWDAADVLSNLASVYYAQGRYAEAEELYRRALQLKEQAEGRSHPDVAIILVGFALVYQAQGKYGEAAALYHLPEGGTMLGFGVKFGREETNAPGQNDREFPVITQYVDDKPYVVWPKSLQVREPVLPLPTSFPYAER